MEGRDRANSKKTLFERQIADISDTLAKASARRDAEVRRRLTPQPQLNVTSKASSPSPVTNPSLTSDAEANIGSESGRSIAFAGDRTEPAVQNFGQPCLDLAHATTIIDDRSASASRCVDHAPNKDDPKIMLTQFEKVDTTNSILEDTDDDDDLKSMLLQLERLKATHGRAGNDHSKGTASKLGIFVEDSSLTVPKCASDDEDDEPRRLLAELASSSLLGQSTVHEDMEDIDAEQLLAELKSGLAVAGGTTARRVDNELTTTPTNIEARAQLSHDIAFMEAPTTVEKMSSIVTESSTTNEEEGIEALYNRLMGLDSSSPNRTLHTPDSQRGKVADSSYAAKPDKEIVPYIIALQLEMSGTRWQEALGWTKYVFSTGLDGHQALRNKDEIMAQANKDMDEITQQVLCSEERYLGTEDKNKIPRRLIVSNLAASATEEDVKEFFHPLRYMIQGVKILPIRDPIKGTQVAHVDMFTRQDAIRGSFTVGNIFGLIPSLELAEKRDS